METVETEHFDLLLILVALALGIGSVGAWFAIFDRLKSGPILPFEPRRPVPWHGAFSLVPVALVVATLVSALTAGDTSKSTELPSTNDIVERIAAGSALQTSLVVAFLAVVVVSSGAKWSDLGLPKDATELARDIRIGVVAWLAAIAPVYATQVAFILLFGPGEGHLLVNVVEKHPDPLTFLVAFLAAVIMAPLCEEPMFRLVLQGSLEKWEDRRLDWRTPPPAPLETVTLVENLEGAEPLVHATQVVAEPASPPEPPVIGVGGLPYGWVPIIVSALLFGLAHFGYGPEPVPLFLLGLILGYVYQRTHRIVPSMVAHALFNSMTLFALWRYMSAGKP
ncbi:MAG: lysostaphin resistance A-like protein [Pirellulales bacterium]